ncbi:inorganic phosphate transporter [Fervidobacterium gondwanense]|uniref:Phosphate transporter n=1 Tax=Fervidobacterium gondwanense DSM 13020 TaxID=1121883 RepID=A0A1M7RQN3_FERGO|nr:inorganic phosphate transporter [Fervidobacterium gondwanense]SHN48605.1 inorganic phosphate transporter, PiT family [Fervidobacterium gondwanense DSM 13020]
MITFIAILVGMFMAFAIGANDVANGMATAVGAKAITPKQAAFMASFLEFLGAVMFGAAVTKTIASGIVAIDHLQDPKLVIYGAISALFAAGIWVMFATVYGMPVSTTHSIIGGMIGFGLASGGMKVVYWSKLLKIVLSWFISPVVGGILAYLVFKIIVVSILHRKSPLEAAKTVAPIMIGFTFFFISLLFIIKTLKQTYSVAFVYSTILFVLSFAVSLVLIRRYIKKNSSDEYDAVENIFKKVQVMTSAYVCFSHGANDVANAVGPIALIFMLEKAEITNIQSVEIPKYILFIGGLGIALGVLLYGYKVMETIGHNITELNNTRGFSVDYGTATTVLLSSIFGFPISTTHTVVGAVTGVGLARGIEVVNFGVLKEIIISWFITVPFAAGVSAIIYLTLSTFF